MDLMIRLDTAMVLMRVDEMGCGKALEMEKSLVST